MDIYSKAGIRQMNSKYNIYPHKRWGQNFLLDKNVLNKIANLSSITWEDYVIEIGPGLGALTRQIASRSKGVLAIEIDPSLQEVLNENLANSNNYRLKFEDVLKVNIEQELSQAFNLSTISTYKVCANIPYNITTPIIFNLLENCPNMEYAVLMMQKEVASRIKAMPGSKAYGLLTVMIQYYADVEFLMDVSRNCFFPRPEVDSAVIKIIPHHPPKFKLKNQAAFKSLVKKAFQMRRKTMLNVCVAEFGVEKERIKKYLDNLDIDGNKRPENLTIYDFISITENWPPIGDEG